MNKIRKLDNKNEKKKKKVHRRWMVFIYIEPRNKLKKNKNNKLLLDSPKLIYRLSLMFVCCIRVIMFRVDPRHSVVWVSKHN